MFRKKETSSAYRKTAVKVTESQEWIEPLYYQCFQACDFPVTGARKVTGSQEFPAPRVSSRQPEIHV